MAIPTQRYSPLGGENQIGSHNFMEVDDQSTINSLSNDNKVPANTNKDYSIEEFSKRLPMHNGKINGETDIAKAFLKSVTDDDHLVNTLGKFISGEFDRDMGKAFGVTSMSLPHSVLSNRMMRRIPTTGCETDLNKLLDLFNRLGAGLNIKLDTEVLIAALLAMLYKLMCNAIPNAFGGIAQIDNLPAQVLARVAAGAIIAGAKRSYPDIVKDIAHSPSGPQVREHLPNVATFALGTLDNYELSNAKNSGKFSEEFIESLDILDPNWGTQVDFASISKNNYIANNVIKQAMSYKTIPVNSGSVTVTPNPLVANLTRTTYVHKKPIVDPYGQLLSKVLKNKQISFAATNHC